METAPVLTVEMVRRAGKRMQRGLGLPGGAYNISPRGYFGILMGKADALRCLEAADDLRCDPCWLEGDGLHWAYLEGG